MNVFLYVALSCTTVQVGNKTTLEWNNRDELNLKHATTRCQVIFPEAPCLIRFEKTAFNTYHATCGEKR